MSASCPRLLAGLIACALLSGCAAAVIGGVAGGGYYATSRERAPQTFRQDATITSTINARYVDDRQINAMDIQVSTYRGTVTLSGVVANQTVLQRAVQLAQSVAGVRRVNSRLSVSTR